MLRKMSINNHSFSSDILSSTTNDRMMMTTTTIDQTLTGTANGAGSPALSFNLAALQTFNDNSSNPLLSPRERCRRCQQLVYVTERIGPLKGYIYHKLCFKCLKCERQLDLKTYFTNSIDFNDKEIYCQSHVPKSGKGSFGAENMQIQSVMKAPKLDVMQKLDDRLKGTHLDSSAISIAHAMKAQLLLQQGREKISYSHKFPALPPDIIHAREEVRRAQKTLEEKQREEEDRLFAIFRIERENQEKKIEKEVIEEWEKKLKMLTSQYEDDLRRKKDKNIERELTLRYKKEKEDLEKHMTLKREKKREVVRKQLSEKEQEQTHSLVSKFSKEMINLIQVKEAEVLGENAVNDEIATTFSMLHSRQPPPPQPPRRRKRDLYEDPSIFEHVDQQAIAVAESEQTSYTELVDQLTYGLLIDLEKARAIFRWITVKDLNAIDFQSNLATDTPMGLLRGIKYGTETYHTLFMRLCSYAGLHCVDIKGHSKSVGYEPGMKILEGKFTNTWNAVVIDDEWRFVQCNWGARHLVMSKDKKPADLAPPKPTREKIKYQYDEHYFLPDPDDFILEFFPYKPEWQLLENQIALNDFEQLPFVRSLFFHYHLAFVNQYNAIIQTDNRGSCDIKLRMPDSLKQRLAFHFHLRFPNSSSLVSPPQQQQEQQQQQQQQKVTTVNASANQEDSTDFQGIKLERYVLHTVQDDLVSFNIHVPQEGDYFIEIFASLAEPDPNPFGQSFKLKCVCKYRILCKQLYQRMHPLPACASGEWGPMKAIRHFNILPLTHFNAIFETKQIPVYIKFKCPKQLKFHGKLNSNQYVNINDSHPLDKYVKYEYEENECIITFIIHLPIEGQYGLDVYARDPDYQTEKRTMSHCCKYIINYSKIATPASASSAVSEQQAISNNKQLITSKIGNGLLPQYEDHQLIMNNHNSTNNNNNNNNNNSNEYRIVSPRITTGSTTASIQTKQEQNLSPKSQRNNIGSNDVDIHQEQQYQTLPMPKIGGNQSLLQMLGMSAVSHVNAVIDMNSNHIDIQFQVRRMIDFSFDLLYHQTLNDLLRSKPSSSLVNLNQRLNVSDYVQIKPNGFNVTFGLNLPKPGLYIFTIYAAASDVNLNNNNNNKKQQQQLLATTNGTNNNSNGAGGTDLDLPPVFTYMIRYVT
ncbi:unnamed protein product [Didymodactylos carnosus]|uniref:LIM zinc-binding domain-containing protein n=1 Tax=Didymodactylos carnosus TaxID=1234261 RepID=A0A8S2KJB7_9BILA|nr:unnamed protein product [Didymodactylos carnosus]CAF3715533.1 unnamed protein product [Didymodactylos carnosus]CAF3844153.1 unnamed protein product [Didymodactylos carnosus]